MKPAKLTPAATPKKNSLFFLAAALFYLASAVQAFSAHRSPQPRTFWVLAALNAAIGTAMLIRGITARNTAPRG